MATNLKMGTNGADTLQNSTGFGLDLHPVQLFGLNASDSLDTTVSGPEFLSNLHDGGSGNDTLSADMTAQSAQGSYDHVSASNTMIGGRGVDMFSARTLALGNATATAFNAISDQTGASFVVAEARSSAAADYYATAASNAVDLGSGVQSVEVTAISEGDAANVVRTGNSGDTITATADANYFSFNMADPGGVDNYVQSRGGDDLVLVNGTGYAGSYGAKHYVDAGGGDDTVVSTINGSGGGGTSGGASGDVELQGGGGQDDLQSDVTVNGPYTGFTVLMNGGAGHDTVESTVAARGDDVFGSVTLLGEGGNDQLKANTISNAGPYGNTVSHALDGGSGNDDLRSYIGTTWNYVSGDQTFSASLIGGFGADHLASQIRIGTTYSPYTSSATNSLTGDGGNDVLCAAISVDSFNPAESYVLENRLYGGSGADTLSSKIAAPAGTHYLYGGSGHDLLETGGGENHRLYGENGNDTLVAEDGGGVFDGGAGEDVLDIDGAGNKYLYGGADADRFHVDPLNDVGYRALMDWNPSEDVLVFENVTDTNGNNAIWDEVNALITGFGNIGANYWVEFNGGAQNGGSTLDFVNTTPNGVDEDIRSYVDDIMQIATGSDLLFIGC